VEELVMHQLAYVYQALNCSTIKKHMMSTQKKDSDYKEKRKILWMIMFCKPAVCNL
jgi:hypothetical protein